MPREAQVKDTIEQEVGLSDALQMPERPVVDAKVVYLGANPNFSMSCKGRLLVEKVGDKVIRTPNLRAGREHYDFASRGTDGEPVPSTPKRGFMPADHPISEVRGQPFVTCAHPEHLYEFSQMRDADQRPLFKIVAPAGAMAIIQDYVQARLRATRRQKRYEDAVTA